MLGEAEGRIGPEQAEPRVGDHQISGEFMGLVFHQIRLPRQQVVRRLMRKRRDEIQSALQQFRRIGDHRHAVRVEMEGSVRFILAFQRQEGADLHTASPLRQSFQPTGPVADTHEVHDALQNVLNALVPLRLSRRKIVGRRQHQRRLAKGRLSSKPL
ncbi:hypothetical protein D3C72_1563810 [compost metagenome]